VHRVYEKVSSCRVNQSPKGFLTCYVTMDRIVERLQRQLCAGGGGYLEASGSKLKTPSGEILKGLNLGGWLVTENWMTGMEDATDAASGRFALETLSERFGPDQARKLMDIWQDNFITSQDIKKIAEMGFNTIRVPFSYRTLQPQTLGKPIEQFPEVTGELDFHRMDWVVREAQKHGMYVIFCYHIWWGQDAGVLTVITTLTILSREDRARLQIGSTWQQSLSFEADWVSQLLSIRTASTPGTAVALHGCTRVHHHRHLR
jgi:hypothetical protein